MVKKRSQQQRGGEGKKAAVEVNRGTWTAEEDQKLVNYVMAHGDNKWRTLPAKAGLKRCGKSCRLRWLNYLRPGIKRGNISEDEEDLIIRLHNLLGNRWSIIAGRIPGRTDNEIKNHWNTHLCKRSLSTEELNKKLNHDSNNVSTTVSSPPRTQRAPNSTTTEFQTWAPQPADENERRAVSRWMEQPTLEFDIEQLFGFESELGLGDFGSELGLGDFGVLPSQHDNNNNNNNQDQFFEFENLEPWLDYQQVYALHSPISG